MSRANGYARLHRIFRELQEKGLIGRERRLVPCPLTFSMRAYPALNCIRYRRGFYDRHLSRASDDMLRFVLLHEEGHIRKGSPLLSILPALPILPYLLLLHLPSIDALFPGLLPAAKIVSITVILLAVFFSYRAYYRRMCDEEFTADRYAAEAMRRCYRIRDPGTLLQNLLSDLVAGRLASSRRRHGGLLRVISGLLRPEPDCRPSISERVQRVRDSKA